MKKYITHICIIFLSISFFNNNLFPHNQKALNMILSGKRYMPNSNLHGAVLNNKYLFGINLRYSNLRYTNFRYSNLRYAKLGHAKLGHAKLGHAKLGHAKLGHAYLENAILDYADLSYANLSYATFIETDFQNTNLTNAKLIGAKFYDVKNFETATVTGADFSDAEGLTKDQIKWLRDNGATFAYTKPYPEIDPLLEILFEKVHARRAIPASAN